MHLSSVQIQWMMFMRILTITIQTEKKIIIVFDGMIADIMTNKRFQAIIKELFIRCRRLNISLVFITQSYFSVPKRCKIKYSTLFYHENKQQQRLTKYCN